MTIKSYLAANPMSWQHLCAGEGYRMSITYMPGKDMVSVSQKILNIFIRP